VVILGILCGHFGIFCGKFGIFCGYFGIFRGHFGIFCGHFGIFSRFWYIAPGKNLATLDTTTEATVARVRVFFACSRSL
jgi:hypothetical protein